MKRSLHYLTLINFLDGLFTAIGIYFNFIEERNPLMRYLYDLHPFLFLSLKIVLSGLLIVLSVFISAESKVKILAAGAAILYSIVCFLHSIWITAIL
jgi:Domain of unknown function (DUF5658)